MARKKQQRIENSEKEVRSIKISSRWLNPGKLQKIKDYDKKIMDLKNEISQFVHDNIVEIFFDKSVVSSQYVLFENDWLDNWELQRIMQRICDDYSTMIKQKMDNWEPSYYVGNEVTYYKRNTKHHKKGDVKTVERVYRPNKLTKLMCKLKKVRDVEAFSERDDKIVKHALDKNLYNRVAKYVDNVRTRILKNAKVIEYTTGTHDKPYSPHGKNGKSLSSYIFKNEDCKEFKWWFCYKNRKDKIYLPLQINEEYHKDMPLNVEAKVRINKNDIEIIITKEAPALEFKKSKKIVGMDLNSKSNFAAFDDGSKYDYDRKWVSKFAKFYKKLEKIGMKNITPSQQRQLEKALRRNEWAVKLLIHEILNDLALQGVTDIVMEDLDKFPSTFIRSEEFEIKYTKLLSLLRLSNVKKWLKGQAEKRGIRVHITHAAYSSQQCPLCHIADRENRLTQEEFACVTPECNYKNNADTVSGINLKSRLTNVLLRDELHNFDKYGRMEAKAMSRPKVKAILMNPKNYPALNNAVVLDRD